MSSEHTPSARLLLVEDDADTLSAMGELLEEYGWQVDAVTSVSDAVLKLQHECYPLVLADYVTGVVREAESEAHALLDAAAPGPVACLTGWPALPEDLAQRYAFVMQKPFSGEALLREIAQVVTTEPRPSDNDKVARYFDALTRKDWDALGALCSDDVVYRVTGQDPELSREVKGRRAFQELSQGAFQDFPNARFEISDLYALPKGAVAHYRGSWGDADQKPSVLDAVVAFSFCDEQICQISVRIDVAKIRQLQHEHGDFAHG